MSDEPAVQIRTHIERHPGLHFNALVRQLEFAPGQVQYHLRSLVDAAEIRREEYYGQTHYYPPGDDSWRRGMLALARRETARDVIFDLLEGGPSRPGDVAARLGIARSTLEWHLDHLVEQDVVAKRRGPQNRVTLVLVDPERTVELLETVEPSLPERMVDRFERLLDQLIS